MSAPPNPAAAAEPSPPLPVPSPRGRGLRYLAAALRTVGVAVLVLPDLLFELDRFTPLAQFVSLRPYTLLGTATVLALLLVLMRFDRRVWPFAAGVLVVIIVGVTMVVPRAIADSVPTGRSLAMVAFNTLDGAADVTAVADLIRAEKSDLVSLVETGISYRAGLAPLVEPLGYRF